MYITLLILLLALDGWSNPRNVSIWNFVIYTSSRKQYLYCLKDFSAESHTGEFIAFQIEEVLNKIGTKKFATIVTDGAANVKEARRIITTKHPYILNLRCIAHCFNLVSGDILKHRFSKNLISMCNKIVKFFKKSHRATKILGDSIKRFQISGGSLKKYCKTRWVSAYDTVESILRLQPCFNMVSHLLKFLSMSLY